MRMPSFMIVLPSLLFVFLQFEQLTLKEMTL